MLITGQDGLAVGVGQQRDPILFSVHPLVPLLALEDNLFGAFLQSLCVRHLRRELGNAGIGGGHDPASVALALDAHDGAPGNTGGVGIAEVDPLGPVVALTGASPVQVEDA